MRSHHVDRPGLILVGASVLALSFAASASSPVAAADPFEVGTTTRTYADPARANRSVPVDLYYPAIASGPDAPVAEGVFPAVSFGHGYLIGTNRYVYLGEGLAAAGFVVLVPRTEGGLFPSHGALGLDLAFVLRAVRDEAEQPTSPFFERIADARAVMGHSMGGGASFLAADSDPTITAIANLAAAETNPSAIEAASRLTIPALLLAADKDCVTPPEDHQIPMYEALGSDCRTLVTLLGGSHCQFAESGSVCELGEGGCDPAGISRAQQHGVVLDLLAPWLRAELNDDPAAWDAFQSRIEGSDLAYVQDCEVVTLAGAHHGDGRIALHVFPQPARGELFLRLESGDPGRSLEKVQVVDASGRVVAEQRMSAASPREGVRWDLTGTDLRSGIYWLRGSLAGGRAARGRLVLIR